MPTKQVLWETGKVEKSFWETGQVEKSFWDASAARCAVAGLSHSQEEYPAETGQAVSSFFYCFDCKKWSCSNSESESQTELCLSWEESPAETGQEAVLGVIVLFVGLCWLPRGYVLDHITLLAKLAKSETSGAEAFKIN